MTSVRILGPIEAWDGDRPIPVGGPRQLKLLAFLVVHANRAVSTDALTDAVWGEARSASDNRLQMAIARLRKALAPLAGAGVELRTVSGGYRLALAPGALDAEVFAATVRDGRRALDTGAVSRARELLASALALWRGPALAEVAFEDFAQAEIRRLDELRPAALEARIDADLRLGRHALLIDELEALIAEHPGRERFAAQLMLALYRSGRQADALATYHRTRTRLLEQLGLEPGPDLQRLQDAILGQDESLRWRPAENPPARAAPSYAPGAARAAPPYAPGAEPPHHNLPAIRTSFVNRVAEVAAIRELLAGHRVVTLLGVGGVGKTRLALDVAERTLEQWPDGAWLVELAAVGEGSAVAEAVAATLGLELAPGARPEDVIAARLEERRLLLVLDNCEHVLEACSALAGRVARGRSGSRLLATSRAPLAVAGEGIVRVAPLTVPATAPPGAPPGDLTEAHAVRLFIERATEARPQFAAGDREQLAAIGSLCRAVDGIPLGIELAASRVRAMTPAEILAHLGGRLSLPSYERDRERRHRDLDTTIAWSYDLLTDRQREAFRRASVFPAPFSLAAAARVIGGGDVAETLLELVDNSILVPAEQPDGTRYRMLDTLRDFGLRRLADSGDAADAHRRLLGWALEFVLSAVTDAETRGRTEVLPRVQAEFRNLVRAVTLDGPAGERLRLAANLAGLLFAGTRLREIQRLLETALEAAGDANTPEVRLARLWLGRTLCKLGELDLARIHLALTADYAAAAGADLMAAAVAADQALVEVKAGQPAEAERLLARSRELGADRDDRVWAYGLLVEAQLRYILLGQLQRARELYEQCIAHVRNHGPATYLITALAALAELEVDLEDDVAVERCAREVLAIADPVADAYTRGGALLALGRAALRAGRPLEATSWLTEAARADVRRGSMETPETLESLAHAIADSGRPREAAMLLGAAAMLRERLGYEPLEPEQPYIDGALRAVNAVLDGGDVRRSWDAGRRLGERELLALIDAD